MLISYIIIDATETLTQETDKFLEFNELLCVGKSATYDDAIDLILEKKPQLIFFHFSNEIPLHLLVNIQQYIDQLPYVIALNATEENAYKALKHGVMDYIAPDFDSKDKAQKLAKVDMAALSAEKMKFKQTLEQEWKKEAVAKGRLHPTMYKDADTINDGKSSWNKK